MAQPLWTPSPARAAATALARFRAEAGDFPDYDALWRWSVSEPAAFWGHLARWLDLRMTPPRAVLSEDPGATGFGVRWFAGSELSFPENLISGPAHAPHDPDATALITVGDGGAELARLTRAELDVQVRSFAGWLRAAGVQRSDRVAGFVSNRHEAVVAALGAAAIGATWTSCSPDFGFRGVLDRFGQTTPVVLVAVDGYAYAGKRIDCRERVAEIAAAIPSIRQVVVVNVLGLDAPGARWADAIAHAPIDEFVRVPFDHPLYVLYSSGTTGVPKCIVHGTGGTLLQHAKEHALHSDVRPGDTVFWFTTCGWMMWNWLISGLYAGATVVLYDGSPTFPGVDTLWRMAERLGVTHFGTSPKFLDAVQKSAFVPKDAVDLRALRAVMSTGSPLAPEQFAWVYEAVKPDVHLASISGGTDIISCFMLGAPTEPVRAGEIQKRGLGMAVAAFDADARPVEGVQGELVCAGPFPSAPVGFWLDPDGSKYRSAYFDHDLGPGVWRHGDWVEITAHGGVVVYGRSDATLNPGGVRIGTAEIYGPVEAMPEIADSLVVGLPKDNDVEVVLFIALRDGINLDAALAARIRATIRQAATPRHVPARILAVPAVPRTLSGKKVELAVVRTLTGRLVDNHDAMANPEALAHFRTTGPAY